MFKNLSLRFRYFVSFTLVLLVIVIFSCLLYQVFKDSNIRYLESSNLEKFTYAAENISILTQSADYMPTLMHLEDALYKDSDGNIEVKSASQIFAILNKLKSNINEDAQVLFYIRGDSNIYTETECIRYGTFERRMNIDYDLAMSQFFRSIMRETSYAMIPILNNSGDLGGIVRIIPISFGDTDSSCFVMYLFPESMLTKELEKYMGDLKGDVYIYDAHLTLLYSYEADSIEHIPYSKLLKQKGIGLQHITDTDIMMSVHNTEYGLNYILSEPSSTFYESIQSELQRFLTSLCVLIIVLLALFVWLILINYRPIYRLATDIAGISYPIEKNELTLIKDSYDRTVDEMERLNDRISNLTPLVMQQFMDKWISGQLNTRDTFDMLARYADVVFPYTYFTVIYFLPGRSSENTDPNQLIRIIQNHHIVQIQTLFGNLEEDAAIYAIVNYDSENPRNDILSIAHQLQNLLLKSKYYNTHIGIGTPSTNPLDIHICLHEAAAAVQLSFNEKDNIRAYFVESSRPSDNFDGNLPAMTVSLVIGSINRSDRTMAKRALKEILQHIQKNSESLLFFRFYASNLANVIVKTAEDNQVLYSKADLQPLLDYKTIREFEENLMTFVDNLCDRIERGHALLDTNRRDKLMAYILEHFKDSNITVQSVLEATQLSNRQMTEIIHNEVGLTFVQYISYLRLNEFKRLLVETNRTITDLVSEVGYQDVSNFLRKFKNSEGVTAGEYRHQFEINTPQNKV